MYEVVLWYTLINELMWKRESLVEGDIYVVSIIFIDKHTVVFC